MTFIHYHPDIDFLIGCCYNSSTMALFNRETVGGLFKSTSLERRKGFVGRVGYGLYFATSRQMVDLLVSAHSRIKANDPGTNDLSVDTVEVVAGVLSDRNLYVKGEVTDRSERKKTVELMRAELEPYMIVYDWRGLGNSDATKR